MKPPLIKLEEFLPYRLSVASETVSRALSETYKSSHGLSNAEWRVIATVGQYPGLCAREIGRHSHMYKVKVSRAIAKLERRQLISIRTNPEDKRETFIHLSDEGTRIYEELAPRALSFEQDLISRLDRQELETFNRILARLQG